MKINLLIPRLPQFNKAMDPGQVVRERIRRRQQEELEAMMQAKPKPADLDYVAKLNEFGLSSIEMLLMGWKQGMIIE